jgi:hypothetical protein
MVYKRPLQRNADIKAELIECANCKYKVQVFSDEIKV